MKIDKYHFVIPLFFSISIVLHFFFTGTEPGISDYYYSMSGNYSQAFLLQRDTIFILSKNYIEISLKEQKARLFQRKDSVLTYRISSGNQNIKLGQSTPEGFFTVQNKSPMAISKQFDNAELFNWIGFNGNVGFHGLKGSGYYGTLGFRPSSHGCVRISREDGQSLYQKVKTGTPVIVYSDTPLRVVKFASPSDMNPDIDYIIQGTSYSSSKLLNQRLQNIYSGKALEYNNFRIFSDGDFILKRSLIQNGDGKRVPLGQKIPIKKKSDFFLSKDNVRKVSDFIFTDSYKIDFR